MRLFIIPAEPLLFRRTGRSFSAGESGYADSLFPPTPETIQGAIRAAIATHWDKTLTIAEAFQQKDLVDLIGIGNRYGRFRITSIALGRRKEGGTVERLFPAPVSLQKDTKATVLRAQPEQEKADDVHSNMPDDMRYLWLDGKTEDKLKPLGWLTESGLLKALRNEIPTKQEIVSNEKIFTYEPRLGIGMDNKTKATQEGLLYQMRMVRMNHTIESEYIYGFVVDIRLTQSPENSEAPAASDHLIDDHQTREWLHFPERGWITLGGERRAAHFEIINSTKAGETGDLEQSKKGNMLYLATPAAFKDGWKPLNWQPERWNQPLPRPIAAAIDHYQPIGGWLLTPGSSSSGGDKPILRCVPAGSLYFFDKNQSVTVEQPFTDHGWQIGYGISYAGDWQ